MIFIKEQLDSSQPCSCLRPADLFTRQGKLKSCIQTVADELPYGYLLHSHGLLMALIEIDGLPGLTVLKNGGSFHGELAMS